MNILEDINMTTPTTANVTPLVTEHKAGNTSFILMQVSRANSRNYNAEKDMENQTHAKTMSIDIDSEKLTADELELLKKYGVEIYTPRPTADNPTPSDFALVKFSGKTTMFDTESRTKRTEVLDDKKPNFSVENAVFAITRNKNTDPKKNDFTRISSMKLAFSKMTVFEVDYFGDADEYVEAIQGEITPEIENASAKDVTPDDAK